MAKMCGERPPVEYESWDFRQGRRFEEDILARLGSSVHHPSSSVHGSFFLLKILMFIFTCGGMVIGMLMGREK
jgi:hypothetical protein